MEAASLFFYDPLYRRGIRIFSMVISLRFAAPHISIIML